MDLALNILMVHLQVHLECCLLKTIPPLCSGQYILVHTTLMQHRLYEPEKVVSYGMLTIFPGKCLEIQEGTVMIRSQSEVPCCRPQLIATRFTPPSPPRASQDMHTRLDPMAPPFGPEITAKTLVGTHLYGHEDVDAIRDHVMITSHCPLLGLLPGSVPTTPDLAP